MRFTVKCCIDGRTELRPVYATSAERAWLLAELLLGRSGTVQDVW